MKTYYIGDLCILSKQTNYRIYDYDVRKIIENKYENGEITKNEHDEFKTQLSAFPYECLNDHKLEQFNNMLSGNLSFGNEVIAIYNNGHVKIMFEKIVRDDGIVYAKEIETGLIFPIGYKKYRKAKNVKKTSDGIRINNISFEFPGMNRVEAFISAGYRVAGYDEAENYLKNSLGSSITENYYKKNVFDGEFKEKKEKETICEELACISDIKYYLTILKEKDEELYKSRKESFDSMLENFDVEKANSSVGLPKVLKFKNRIIFDILFRMNDSNSNELMKKINDFLNGSKNIDFDYTDYLCEIFLQFQNDIDKKSALNILYDFAMTYLLCVLSNDIDNEKIYTSHMSDLLSLIITASHELASMGVIENGINLELNDITIENVVTQINKIKNTYQRKL